MRVPVAGWTAFGLQVVRRWRLRISGYGGRCAPSPMAIGGGERWQGRETARPWDMGGKCHRMSVSLIRAATLNNCSWTIAKVKSCSLFGEDRRYFGLGASGFGEYFP